MKLGSKGQTNTSTPSGVEDPGDMPTSPNPTPPVPPTPTNAPSELPDIAPPPPLNPTNGVMDEKYVISLAKTLIDSIEHYANVIAASQSSMMKRFLVHFSSSFRTGILQQLVAHAEASNNTDILDNIQDILENSLNRYDKMIEELKEGNETTKEIEKEAKEDNLEKKRKGGKDKEDSLLTPAGPTIFGKMTTPMGMPGGGGGGFLDGLSMFYQSLLNPAIATQFATQILIPKIGSILRTPLFGLAAGMMTIVWDGYQEAIKENQTNGTLASAIGGILGGQSDQSEIGKWFRTFSVGMGGAAIGSVVGGPIGMIAGGLLAIAVDSIMTAIGPERIANFAQGAIDFVQKTVDNIMGTDFYYNVEELDRRIDKSREIISSQSTKVDEYTAKMESLLIEIDKAYKAGNEEKVKALGEEYKIIWAQREKAKEQVETLQANVDKMLKDREAAEAGVEPIWITFPRAMDNIAISIRTYIGNYFNGIVQKAIDIWEGKDVSTPQDKKLEEDLAAHHARVKAQISEWYNASLETVSGWFGNLSTFVSDKMMTKLSGWFDSAVDATEKTFNLPEASIKLMIVETADKLQVLVSNMFGSLTKWFGNISEGFSMWVQKKAFDAANMFGLAERWGLTDPYATQEPEDDGSGVHIDGIYMHPEGDDPYKDILDPNLFAPPSSFLHRQNLNPRTGQLRTNLDAIQEQTRSAPIVVAPTSNSQSSTVNNNSTMMAPVSPFDSNWMFAR